MNLGVPSFSLGEPPRGLLESGHPGAHCEAGIQSFGLVLLVREPELLVVQASANAASGLGLPRDPVGCPLSDLGGDLAERIRSHPSDPLTRTPLALRCRAGTEAREYSLILHPPSAAGRMIELEPAESPMDLAVRIHEALESMADVEDPARLYARIARIFAKVGGHEQVLVCRLDGDACGEVVAERRASGLVSCLERPLSELGLVPRAFGHWKRIRLLADCAAPPVPIRPMLSPRTGRAPDLLRCACRDPSRPEREFLARMGMRAALVVPIAAGDRPWGFVLCLHPLPRFVHYECRALCELLAEAVSARLMWLDGQLQARAEKAAQRLEAAMIEAIARGGDWTQALLGDPESILAPVAASGAVLFHEGRRLAIGRAPEPGRLEDIVDWLDARPRANLVATTSLGREASGFADLFESASGLLAAPLATGNGEYLVWLRAAARGGEPRRGAFAERAVGLDPLAPPGREPMVEEWQSWDSGRSAPWTSADRATARILAASIADMIQQFRSVRVLIAQARLAQERSRMKVSDQPILIADGDGRVLLTTQAWDRRLGARGAGLESLGGLADLCAEPLLASYCLGELLRDQRPWRGQIGLRLDGGHARPFMVRADAVLAAAGRPLGYILMLDELVGQTRFREPGAGANEPPFQGRALMRSPSHGDLLRALLGNAGLPTPAAPEAALPPVSSVGDDVDDSVARTMDLLEALMRYSGWARSETPDASR